MKVHVFGNSPSPTVATYWLRRAVQQCEDEYGTDCKQFVMRNFYVDDGLTSVPTETEAINLLTRTREMLAVSNLRLHKITSNSAAVMASFPAEDLANDLKDLDLGTDALPLQCSLGLVWNLQTDYFTFQVSKENKPFTRRGILSTINSLFDHLGLVAPMTRQGKVLVREISTEEFDWDTPLPPEKETPWEAWKGF